MVLFAGIGIVGVVRWMMPAVYAVEEPPVLPQEAPPLEQLAPVEMPAYTQLYPELYVSSAELLHTQGKVAISPLMMAHRTILPRFWISWRNIRFRLPFLW